MFLVALIPAAAAAKGGKTDCYADGLCDNEYKGHADNCEHLNIGPRPYPLWLPQPWPPGQAPDKNGDGIVCFALY